MTVEQLSIDGQSLVLTPDGVMKITRQVMHDKPLTYKSHRLLMREIAKAWGFPWDTLPRHHQQVLERLFDLSPDIERNARKVRDEDAALLPPPTPTAVKVEVGYKDPFDAVNNAMKKKAAQRRHWRR